VPNGALNKLRRDAISGLCDKLLKKYYRDDARYADISSMCELPEHVVKSDAAHEDGAVNAKDYTAICSCMTRAQLDTLIGYECFDEFYLDFEIYTENNHSEIYLDNLDFLYRYKLQPIENKYEDQILEMINKNNKISAFDLANLISKNPIKYGLISNCIWDLVCKEKLKTNLELSKITMNSLVELYYE
jgi:hypothetical protein